MKIGILGATGAVGRQMLECIEERNIDAEEVRVFASERSKGKTLPFKGGELTIEVADEENLKGLDYVLGAVSNAMSKYYRPLIQAAGAVYIDNSSAFRLEDGVPLVVPEINGEDALKHNGIIANPNCSTIITMMALAPVAKISRIKNVTATTFQAVSGAGIGGFRELEEQVEQVAKGEAVTPHVFPAQIAYNCIAEIGSYNDNGYTTEEMKMQNEGRKILHLPELTVTCTCVRVPVFRSHSISAAFETEEYVSVEDAEKAIAAFEGDKLVKDHVPSPLETSNQDIVYVGRVRRDLNRDNALTLWCCGDQIRKGAASNAVEIMEYLENH
ncbi:MAG: aspartate-semialdehyde dehydrogenase [Solobacterium sp.]|nr:aspartate-semialdehyde dehydrogenase [Solobacterium sp.]MBQ9824130.1 aspartate-semialdehyde dehydrogenase [Solobacterium sp.]